MNEEELSARMRLAYTQATVGFPRTLNALPISNEVYRIFEAVHRELGKSGVFRVRRAFEPLDDELVGAMSALVLKSVDEIRCKTVPGEVTSNVPQPAAKQLAALVSGLDRNSALTLLAYVRTPGRTPEEVRTRRSSMLSTRRNMLANRLVKDCVRGARTYFLSEVPEHARSDA